MFKYEPPFSKEFLTPKPKEDNKVERPYYTPYTRSVIQGQKVTYVKQDDPRPYVKTIRIC